MLIFVVWFNLLNNFSIMGIVTGDMQGVTGRVGNTVYYQKDGKTYARKATNAGKRNMDSPTMVRVAENIAEFKDAAQYSRMLRTPFKKQTKGNIAGVLTANLLAIAKQYDTTNPRGTRSMKSVNNEWSELRGFELNKKTTLDSVLLGAGVILGLANNGTNDLLEAEMNAFWLNAPQGATHFLLEISGAVFEVAEGKKAVLQYKRQSHAQAPQAIPANTEVPAIPFALTFEKAISGSQLVVGVFGVSFFQEVNGTMYQLNEGAMNPATILEVTRVQ
jgi:hypothetical protein